MRASAPTAALVAVTLAGCGAAIASAAKGRRIVPALIALAGVVLAAA
jgi:hypothetical protein